MARQVIPKKIIISSSDDGKSFDILLAYRINDNGNIGKQRTVNIKSGVSSSAIVNAIRQGIDIANTAEAIV
jgi:hypothetical protein